MPAKKKSVKRTNASAMGKKGAARKRAAPKASLANALAEAAWADADKALAEALIELDEFENARNEKAREAALTLLAQALAQTARKRGLTRIGMLGAQEAFDPQRHEPPPRAKSAKSVRIAARGVARGAEVLARARTEAPRRRSPR